MTYDEIRETAAELGRHPKTRTIHTAEYQAFLAAIPHLIDYTQRLELIIAVASDIPADLLLKPGSPEQAALQPHAT